VEGSFVVKDKKIHKVPATDAEAVSSTLLGLMEKQRAKKFFVFVQEYDPDNPKTHKGFDLKTATMRQVFHKFKLEENTIDFLGHALALYRDDQYLDQPALPTIERVRQYCESLSRYGKSPFIYPLYGLGELPQAFARLAAIYGGTYMLNKPVQKIVFNDKGEAVGVQSEGETAKCKFVVGDPSYFPDKVKKTGQVVRAICILSHPIPETNNSESVQIIVPAKQVGRKSDIYISAVSFAHNVAPKGKWIGIVACSVETATPDKEVAIGMSLLGPIDEKFVYVSDTYTPVANGAADKCFISESFDATSHFETATADVLKMYKRITGKDVDLDAKPKNAQEKQ